MYFHPNTTKIRITATFRNTMKPLKIELPSVPRIRKILISTTISAAGIFTIPPSQGQAANAWGILIPTPSRKTTRYLLQLILTVVAATVYSNTRSQPIIHAISSPIVAYEYV